MNTIKGMIEDLNNKDTHIGGCTTVGELIIALERLQMLEEQQPCEDCISREEFERRIKPYDTEDKTDKALYNFAHNTLIGCPSVQPQPKRGKWIKYNVDIAPHPLHCSECGWSNHHLNRTIVSDFKHCPKCGADMRGDSE